MQIKLSAFEGRGAGCKDHPNDKKLPGVCSSCLRDKLSQLYTKDLITSPSPKHHHLSSFVSGGYGSSNQTVPDNRRRFRRNGSHALDTGSCMVSFNYGLNLKKSRSVVVASRSRNRERDGSGGGYARNKDGFWSKVLKLRK